MKIAILQVSCTHCKSIHEIDVMERDYDKWMAGAHTQQAFPYLTPGQRELLISRTCDACWKRIFGEE